MKVKKQTDKVAFRNHAAKLIYYLRAEHKTTFKKLGEIMGISSQWVFDFYKKNLKGK